MKILLWLSAVVFTLGTLSGCLFLGGGNANEFCNGSMDNNGDCVEQVDAPDAGGDAGSSSY